MVRKIVGLALILGACAPSVMELCGQWGFAPGTPEFSNCAMRVSEQRAFRRQRAIEAWMQYQGSITPQYPGTVVMPAAPVYTPPPQIIIQRSNPTFGGAVQPTVDLLNR